MSVSGEPRADQFKTLESASFDDPQDNTDGPRQRRTILIVEDEPGLAEIIAINLEASGFDTIVAHDGLEALYLLDRSTPDIVVLDLQLPQVSGFRLIQLLRGRVSTAHVPIVVITALSFREAEDVIRAGADAFLTKPFDPGDVVARVEQLVRRMG